MDGAARELGVPGPLCMQNDYSIVNRRVEENGLSEASSPAIANSGFLAYNVLAGGMLTGKYSETNLPSGARQQMGYNADFCRKAAPLLDLMRIIGDGHGGKTPSQVALNWLLPNPDVTVIPGAKNRQQVEELMGALGWQLAEGEVEELRKAAKAVPPVQGFPAEKF